MSRHVAVRGGSKAELHSRALAARRVRDVSYNAAGTPRRLKVDN
jgi:hypothetical protein